MLISFWIARDIRIATDLIPGISLPTRTIDAWYLICIALGAYAIIGTIFAFQKLYAIDKTMGIIEECFMVIKSIFVSFFIAIGVLYMTNGFPYETILIPRLILIYAFLIVIGGILFERILIRILRGYGLRK